MSAFRKRYHHVAPATFGEIALLSAFIAFELGLLVIIYGALV